MSPGTKSGRPAGRKSAPARPAGAATRRPVPQQDRGRKRVEEILDAAEQVIAEVGVPAMTTNAVAERAGAGMGSLYRFFENKDAIVDALAQRYMTRMEGLTAYAAHPELGRLSLADLTDAIVDPLVEFFRRTPAYVHVFHAVNQPGAQNPGCAALRELVVKNVEALMLARAPQADARAIHPRAKIAVELVHTLLATAFEEPPAQRRAIIDETKRLLALYSEMIQGNDDPLVRLR